ncbi:hypothetical protein FRC10_002449 [Ceratobasidium sp. 414]|nr:hypothetical protein FRC10_002449 [Ceratobasidium sp. 414]
MNARTAKAIEFLASVEHNLHDRVVHIYNNEHQTAVDITNDANGAPLIGSIEPKEDTQRRKESNWRLKRCDAPGSNWYLICPADDDSRFVSLDPTSGTVNITNTRIWWAIEPIEDATHRYM